MAASLAARLQVKPEMSVVVFNAPASLIHTLRSEAQGEVAVGDDLPGGAGKFDVVFLFAKDSGELERWYNTAERALNDAGSIFWVAYPKKSSGVGTDLTRDEGWSRIWSDGWKGVRSISIDEVWTGIRFKRAEQQAESDLIDAQYAGAKAALRPLYNQLVEILAGFGSDVRFEARQSYVAVRREKHFAAIQPSTKTRLDVAIKLKGAPFSDRFQANSGVGGGALTHKVALASVGDIDDDLVRLLRTAYEQNA